MKSRQLGMCLDPKTRVLTADLNWVFIKDLVPGQEIVAVDELSHYGRGKSRKMKTATVEKVVFMKAQAYRISFDDGRSLVCTSKHPWLSKKSGSDTEWRAIEPTKHGRGVLKVGTKVRWITKPWESHSFEDGWFGGILDGEGSIAKHTHSSSVNAAQRSGDVWDRMLKYADDNQYHYRIETDNRKSGTSSKLGNLPVHKICFGRIDELFRLIGSTRPSRFIHNRFWEGRELPGKKTGIGWSTIVKIENVGEQTVVDLQTSAKTYIAEGFVSHNTTYAAIDMLDDALFTKNYNGLIISHEQKISIELFKNKIYYAWENFPAPLKELYQTNAERANQLVFDFGDGTSSTIATGASGVSGTFSRVHITELGLMVRKYPEKVVEVLKTIPAVPSSGRIDIESTARGNYGMFHDMFWEAWNRKRAPYPTEYKAHFYNWTWDDAEFEDIKIAIPVSEMDESLKFAEYQKLHDLTDKQITYYYLKWLSNNKSWSTMKEEYPTTPEEAFIGSGHPMFDQDVITKLLKNARNGKEDGDWIFYEPYIDQFVYAIGVDVAEGVGQDSSTIVVLCFSESRVKVVAEFCSNKIAPDVLAYEVKRGAEKYGNALVAVERNNHGHTTIATLKGIYQNLYTEVTVDSIEDKMTTKYGWLTTGASKPKMMYELKSAVNNDQVDIPSKLILQEMRTYDKEDLGVTRFDENQSRHWDRLMAMAIAYQMKAFAFEEDAEVIPFNKEKF